jgi:hypothetical protein
VTRVLAEGLLGVGLLGLGWAAATSDPRIGAAALVLAGLGGILRRLAGRAQSPPPPTPTAPRVRIATDDEVHSTTLAAIAAWSDGDLADEPADEPADGRAPADVAAALQRARGRIRQRVEALHRTAGDVLSLQLRLVEPARTLRETWSHQAQLVERLGRELGQADDEVEQELVHLEAASLSSTHAAQEQARLRAEHRDELERVRRCVEGHVDELRGLRDGIGAVHRLVGTLEREDDAAARMELLGELRGQVNALEPLADQIQERFDGAEPRRIPDREAHDPRALSVPYERGLRALAEAAGHWRAGARLLRGAQKAAAEAADRWDQEQQGARELLFRLETALSEVRIGASFQTQIQERIDRLSEGDDGLAEWTAALDERTERFGRRLDELVDGLQRRIDQVRGDLSSP